MIENKKDQISEKTIRNKESPSGIAFDTVHVKVYEVELNLGPYAGYDESYGIEVVVYDDAFDQDKYEYYETVSVQKIGRGKIKSFIDRIKNEKNFNSIEDMIIYHVTRAVEKADEHLLNPKYENPEADSTEDRAEAALDALEELE
jgi:CRISPR/Cas system-associated protein Cas7 (RAMP superfamily)